MCKLNQLKPKIFLTGASSGIGLAIAKHLCLSNRCEVWGTSRSIDRLPNNLPLFHRIQLDLNDLKVLPDRFLSAQKAAGGHFDVLINNAGDGWFGPAIEVSNEIMRKQFETLLFAPFQLIQMAIPAMRQAAEANRAVLKRSLIINISSLAGRLHLPYAAPYNAAKAAMSALTATLQMEEVDTGSIVRIIDIQPGDFCTNFNQAMKITPSQFAARATNTESNSSKGRWPNAVKAAQKVLEVSDHDVNNGPSPDLIAQRVEQYIFSNCNPAVVALGMFSQAVLGPIGLRVFPARLMQYIIRKHFKLS